MLKVLNIFKTFTIVTLLWSVFRAPDFNSLHQLFSALYHNFSLPMQLEVSTIVWIALGSFILLDLLIRQNRFDVWCGQKNGLVRWTVYALMIFAIIVFSSVQQYPFIYFQF